MFTACHTHYSWLADNVCLLIISSKIRPHLHVLIQQPYAPRCRNGCLPSLPARTIWLSLTFSVILSSNRNARSNLDEVIAIRFRKNGRIQINSDITYHDSERSCLFIALPLPAHPFSAQRAGPPSIYSLCFWRGSAVFFCYTS